MIKFIHLSILLLISVTMLSAQSRSVRRAFKAEVFTSATDFQLPYRVLWPKGYEDDTEQKYPLILFLHGAGERGTDNELQLVHGSSMFLENREDYPAIVVMPQCATGDYWAQVAYEDQQRFFNFDEIPNPSTAAALELLDYFLSQEQVDADRVYIMGLSMGGMGTFEVLARRPNTFAAAVPICGGTNTALLPIYAEKVPLWIFHGADDSIVTVEHSRQVVKALEMLGVPVKYTEYPGVNHNSWDNAFADPDLLPWLWSHRRSTAGE